MKNELRVLLAAPTRRDGEVTCELLRRAQVECLTFSSLHDLANELQSGAGAVVLTDSSLRR